jgi:hypothetical protein
MKSGPYATFYQEGSSTALAPDSSGDVTLGVHTYYAEIGDSDRSRGSAHVRWDGTIVASALTYERTNFPEALPYTATGVQDTWVDSGITSRAIAASLGSYIQDFANDGAARMRLKVVVTTGGKLRVRPQHKGL